MLGDQRFGAGGGPLQGGQGGWAGGVAQGHADVAQEAAPFPPEQRRAGKAPLEAGLVQGSNSSKSGAARSGR